MARFMKKTIAFVLVLTTIFLFSTAAFAAETDQTQATYCGKTVCATLTHGDKNVTAMIQVTNDVNPRTNLTAIITIDYVYCPEDALRPSNYMYSSKTGTYNQNGNGPILTVVTSNVPSNYVIISATATFELYANSTSDPYIMDSLTIYPY